MARQGEAWHGKAGQGRHGLAWMGRQGFEKWERVLNAGSPQEEEQIRLYSRGYRLRAPVDEIAPQHEPVHALLCRWGSWASARRAGRTLASVEGLYTKAGTPAATAPLAADKSILAVERALVGMPGEHEATIRRLYVYRMTPLAICKMMRPPLRYEAWTGHIFTCRCMVINRLRFNES